MADQVLQALGKQILRGTDHYADAATPGIATEIVAMEQRALAAESLLSSMMKGGALLSQALGEAGETFGYLHACMFGAEQHLRENGWLKAVDTYPDERPF